MSRYGRNAGLCGHAAQVVEIAHVFFDSPTQVLCTVCPAISVPISPPARDEFFVQRIELIGTRFTRNHGLCSQYHCATDASDQRGRCIRVNIRASWAPCARPVEKIETAIECGLVVVPGLLNIRNEKRPEWRIFRTRPSRSHGPAASTHISCRVLVASSSVSISSPVKRDSKRARPSTRYRWNGTETQFTMRCGQLGRGRSNAVSRCALQ